MVVTIIVVGGGPGCGVGGPGGGFGGPGGGFSGSRSSGKPLLLLRLKKPPPGPPKPPPNLVRVENSTRTISEGCL